MSSELIVRLSASPKLRGIIDALPPKVLSLSASGPTAPVDWKAESLETRVEDIQSRIERATFTSKSDKSNVVRLYKDYVARIATALLKTTALSEAAVQETRALPPIPAVSLPDTTAVQLADGQLLLSFAEGGSTRFGVVAGGRVNLTLAGGDAELSFDRCSQQALPWRPSFAPGWEAALRSEVEALRPLGERCTKLDAELEALATPPAPSGRLPAVEECMRSAEAEASAILEAARAQPTVAVVTDDVSKGVRAAFASVLETIARHQSGSVLEPLSLDVQPLRQQLARLGSVLEPAVLETLAAAALRSTGAVGYRSYLRGQSLTVRTEGGRWVDTEAGDGGLLTLDGKEVQLHPWNHAPLEMPHAAFEALVRWWKDALHEQHQYIYDALTGTPLHVLDQTVPIGVLAHTELASISNAVDLGNWLTEVRAKCCLGHVADSLAMILEGPPASGKTCLMSQVVMRTLRVDESIPILIKVQRLQQRKLQSSDAFAAAWNWVDAYLRLEHDEPIYRMLRQVLMCICMCVHMNVHDEPTDRILRDRCVQG